MENKTTIIRIRKGLNGFKYSACDKNGYFIMNFEKLADVRRYWKRAIKSGKITLVRELDKMPDLTLIDTTKKQIESILKEYARKKGRRK